MALVKRTLADPATYRELLYLVSAIPLGTAWFVGLVTVWSLCLGFLITPFVIPLLFVLAFMTRGFATVEAELSRSLLGADAHPPAMSPPGRGFRARLKAMFGAGFWRAQAYLLIRWFAGFPLGVVILSVLATALGMIFAPVWVPFVHGGAHLGFWRPHTFAQSLALVPAGLILLPIGLLFVKPVAAAFRSIASGLLEPGGTMNRVAETRAGSTRTAPSRRSLEVHAAVDGVLLLGLVVIWGLTSRGYFWPIWIALPFGVALGIHGWAVLLAERPSLVAHLLGSSALAISTGVGAVVAAFFIAIWAITGHAYFWPIWPILGIAIVLAAIAAGALVSSPGRAEMVERIETLEHTRAGAVDLQESELRRIERDLHDGAQARLVALGMSLGMAEQKLAEDPTGASELLAEARAGAEHALRELRDLARGIHPPVLADRGLEAALASLVNSTLLRVTLSVELPERPAPAPETAAYFIVTEALANAAKHAQAHRVVIHVGREGDTLELSVTDDGVGGANPNGTGLLGMRRRVEALDGTLSVISPPGGPTTIRAQLPCGS
jgi:signal transduction histidine kinase